MAEPLPITINPCEELQQQFTKISAVLNKLEAQFNFQTLSAGWYEVEQNIQWMQLFLETPQSFGDVQQQHHLGKMYEFADDVICYHQCERNQLSCFIAITEFELQLLLAQDKLLSHYTETKLRKVLNLLANKLLLYPI